MLCVRTTPQHLVSEEQNIIQNQNRDRQKTIHKKNDKQCTPAANIFLETDKSQDEFKSLTKLQIEEKREKWTPGVNNFGQPAVPPKCLHDISTLHFVEGQFKISNIQISISNRQHQN